MAKRGTASKASSRRSDRGEASDIDGLPEAEDLRPIESLDAVEAAAARQPAKARAAAKMPTKTAARKAAAITITDIGDHLAATFDMPKSHARIYLTEAVTLIAKQLKKGAKVRLRGLGAFEVKKRPARKARNPNTGEEVKVKAGRRITFTVARDLKTKL